MWHCFSVDCTASLAAEAVELCSAFKDVLSVEIFDEDKCKDLKMGAYLGVAAAATNRPKFIHMKYRPPSGETNIKLAIVGKGLTFDR
jgi:leucyl aminopeptidase